MLVKLNCGLILGRGREVRRLARRLRKRGVDIYIPRREEIGSIESIDLTGYHNHWRGDVETCAFLTLHLYKREDQIQTFFDIHKIEGCEFDTPLLRVKKKVADQGRSDVACRYYRFRKGLTY